MADTPRGGDSDRRELTDDLGTLLQAHMRATQQGIWTTLPAFVTKYTPEAMTCEVQPTIKALVLDQFGQQTWVQLPVLVDCPVVFPSGGGFTLTFPLTPGDEVLVCFSSRCIDSWFQSSGVQVQSELRMHDINDGFIIPGPKSLPNKLQFVSAVDVQLRSNDGATSVVMTPGAEVIITGPVNVTINSSEKVTVIAPQVNITGDVSITGKLDVSGIITGADLVTPAVRSYNVHQHGGVTNGGSSTSPPTPGT